MTTRTTLKNSAPHATEETAADEGLLSLLSFTTTSEAVRVGDVLRERLESAETRVQAHAQGADDAALSGETAQQAHEAEAARLQREVERLGLAIKRADARLAEVAEHERFLAAEAEQAKARLELAAGRQDLTEIRELSKALATRIAGYGERCNRIEAANRIMTAGGLGGVLLPHVAESEPDTMIEREVFIDNSGPRITDSEGREIRGTDARGKLMYVAQPTQPVERTRRVEREHVRGRKARDPRRAGFVLPDVLNDRLNILRQD